MNTDTPTPSVCRYCNSRRQLDQCDGVIRFVCGTTMQASTNKTITQSTECKLRIELASARADAAERRLAEAEKPGWYQACIKICLIVGPRSKADGVVEAIQDVVTELETLRAQFAAAQDGARRLREALRIIQWNGGGHTDEGLSCNGSWCAEQARAALAAQKEGAK